MHDEVTYETLLGEWKDLQPPEDLQLDAWQEAMESMRAEMTDLRSRGLWLSGGRTLLRQLGLHHDEVLLCRGLGWLLTADGWHGLGDALLRRFVETLGLPTQELEQATISLEETRGVTRADVVVRYPGVCVVVEAKMFAGEQPGQADRLAQQWADEDPHLVFLTRDGRAPVTAQASAGRWTGLRWSDLAALMSADTEGEGVGASPGALELIDTWKHYGG